MGRLVLARALPKFFATWIPDGLLDESALEREQRSAMRVAIPEGSSFTNFCE